MNKWMGYRRRAGMSFLLAGVMAAMTLAGGCAGGGQEKMTEPEETGSEAERVDVSETESTESLETVTADKKLTLDIDTQYQTVDGFGAAYTWYADWLLRCNETEEAFDALFLDAKLSVLRFKNEYEYDEEDRAGNADTMFTYYNEAKERAAQYGEEPIVLMCCWSPPAQLKEGGDRTGAASLRKNAQGDYDYEAYAAWWVESVQYYEACGIPVDYVCIQNEVDFAADYDGCRFEPQETDTCASFAKAYMAVYDAFQEIMGADAPKMIGPETMSCEVGTIASYMDEVEKTKPESIDGIAHHLYVGGTADGNMNGVEPDSFTANLMELYQYTQDKGYSRWQTEYYIGHGIETAALINNCLVYEQVNTYLYWSGVWDDSSPDSEEAGYLLGCRYSEADWPNEKGWRLMADYYAIRHFSEFVRPGYVRIKALTGDTRVKSSAYVNPEQTKLAIVFINGSEDEITYQVGEQDWNTEGSQVIQSVFGTEVTDVETLYVPQGELPENQILTLPAYSVTTIEILL